MARLVSPGRTVVLVAEDESLVRMFTADFLVEAGYTVIEASSAVAALRQLEVTPNVRVLLTDVEMPGEMDGLELAREVQSRWPEVVIIVTSGRARPGREVEKELRIFSDRGLGPSRLRVRRGWPWRQSP